MNTALWRPEVNAMTVPQSYRICHVVRNTYGYAELSDEVERDNPNYNAGLVESVLRAAMLKMQQLVSQGHRVSLENAFSCALSFTGRLNSPDDPLPPIDEIVQVSMYISRTFLEEVRQNVQLERTAMIEKLPVVASVEDTSTNLPDTLDAEHLLKISGTNLNFDSNQPKMGCSIEGTRSGKARQVRYGIISNALIVLSPEIPAQNDQWNNEYKLSISTRYTSNGSIRTGIYRRMLRTPIQVILESQPGILTGNATAPYATITGALIDESETVRIEAIYDVHAGNLLLRLLNMIEGDKAGEQVRVSGNGNITLNGFAGSSLTQLSVTINNYNQLLRIVRSDYVGRLVDILKMQVGS
jgi:hypothetical protein